MLTYQYNDFETEPTTETSFIIPQTKTVINIILSKYRVRL
jgi:hypothetical protein